MTKRSTSPLPASKKRIPQRTCVACRRITGKRELVRLVRTADGGVEIDVGGKEAGRGAYLCPTWVCWETALKGGRLENTLRTSLTGDNRQRLISRGEELLLGENRDRGR